MVIASKTIKTLPIPSISNDTNLILQHPYKYTIHIYSTNYNKLNIINGLTRLDFQK